MYKRQVYDYAAIGEHVDAIRIMAYDYSTAEPGPVSYTHLRAHETVLDFVCRLLLAKNITIHIHS